MPSRSPDLSGRRLVEAAGIEPASRDSSVKTSTCIVLQWFSSRWTPKDRIPSGPVRTHCLVALPSNQTARPARCGPPTQVSRARPTGGDCFTQPLLTGCQQLFFARFFRRPPDTLRTPSSPLSARSIPDRPLSQKSTPGSAEPSSASHDYARHGAGCQAGRPLTSNDADADELKTSNRMTL